MTDPRVRGRLGRFLLRDHNLLRRSVRSCATIVALAVTMTVAADPIGDGTSHVARPGSQILETPTRRVFRFDDGFTASPGLGFSFQRATPALDAGGAVLPPDVPRFAPPRLFAGAPPEPEVLTLIEDRPHFLHTPGYDRDGTPILVVWLAGHNRLHVLRGPDPAVVLQTLQPGPDQLLTANLDGVTIAHGRWRMNAEHIGDGARYGDPDHDYVIMRGAGTVCQGAIIVACRKLRASSGAQVGVALLVSQDLGRSWSLIRPDAQTLLPGDPDPGRLRGADWCLQNWWTPQRTTPATEAWITLFDYMNQTGGPVTRPNAGRAFLWRIRRATNRHEWDLTEPLTLIYEHHNDFGSPGQSVGLHIQGAALAFHDDTVQALVSIGDGYKNNAVDRGAVHADAYHDRDAWLWQSSTGTYYHGSQGYGDEPDDPGADAAFQFVGAAPGPAPDEVILGSDPQVSGITAARVQHRLDGVPRLEPRHLAGPPLLWGRSERFINNDPRPAGGGWAVFQIRCTSPDLGREYAAALKPKQTSFETTGPYTTLVYSPNGTDWIPVTRGFEADVNTPSTVALGEHLYLGREGQRDGLTRFRKPATRTAAPLLVGPGTGPAGNFVQPAYLTLSASNGDIIPVDHADLPVSPPSGGPAFRLTLPHGGGTDPLMLTRIDPGREDFPDGCGWIRMWAMPATPGRNMSLEVRLDEAETIDLTGHSTFDGALFRASSVCVDSWTPIDVFFRNDPHPLSTTWALNYVIMRQQRSGCDYYLCVDQALCGGGHLIHPAYPAPPAAGTTNQLTDDERAAVTGFSTGPRWSILLAGHLPADGWDSRALEVMNGEVPLFTIWGNDENHILITARGVTAERPWHVDEQIVMRIARGNALRETIIHDLPMLRESNVQFAVICDGLTTSLTVATGDAPRTISEPLRIDAVREVRFHADGVPHFDAPQKTAAFAWLGGAIYPDAALTESATIAQMRGLGYLDIPSTPAPACHGDTNGDGRVNAADLVVLLGNFGCDG